MAGLSYHICGKLEVAFKSSHSSQHQHCTDEAQKAETELSAVSYIHLFQKTLSERTANGSCRTEIARPKGTVVSILMSSSRGAKLGSLSNHDDDSYTNPTNLHI